MLASLLLTAVLAGSDPSADLDKALAMASSGDLEGAGDLLKSVTATFPTWGLAQIELSRVLLESGGDDPLLGKTLAAARSLEPLNPRTWLLSGRYFEQKDENAKALEAFQRAVDLRPDLLEGHVGLGRALHQAGRSAEAASHLRLAAASRPGDRALGAMLADALEQSGDLEGAETALRALVAAAPKNPIFRRLLVDFLDRTGQDGKAAAEAKKLDAISGKSARKLRSLPASRR